MVGREEGRGGCCGQAGWRWQEGQRAPGSAAGRPAGGGCRQGPSRAASATCTGAAPTAGPPTATHRRDDGGQRLLRLLDRLVAHRLNGGLEGEAARGHPHGDAGGLERRLQVSIDEPHFCAAALEPAAGYQRVLDPACAQAALDGFIMRHAGHLRGRAGLLRAASGGGVGGGGGGCGGVAAGRHGGVRRSGAAGAGWGGQGAGWGRAGASKAVVGRLAGLEAARWCLWALHKARKGGEKVWRLGGARV